ncbi:GHMP kinase [Streptomyces sp. NPDC057376]|uniref:GHMP family kinase ATP-binding protein n=1 Tax=unclassified Streptomyces TaxID=2593676 RepID=UPI000969425D|nr:GHMP kinase [Streptomyces sp. CB02414]OKI84244.1 GHMP kinase [Streptomyces sp. CB02414]
MTSATRRPASPDAAARETTGTGHAACHHGEILQGVFLDERRRPRHGLVTLPMTARGSTARFTHRPGSPPGEVTVTPGGRAKARAAAVLALRECAERLGEEPCGGELTLTGDLPVGLGMGSSTSDVIATVRAVADSRGLLLPPETIARLAVRAEGASDPLMHGCRPLLFAQREGRVLETLGSALPPAVVVGCALGGGEPVDTLSLPVVVAHDDLAAYEHLRRMLRRAVTDADTALLGRVGTASARLRQRVLRHQEFPALTGIADSVGAAGVQIAHSGNVAGILFDPRVPGLNRRLHRCARALDREGIPSTRTFTTFATPASEEYPRGRTHLGGHRPTGPDTPRRRTRLPAV